MKIVTIFGTRPQFIKVPLVSIELKKNNINEVLVNTGQHYDFNMSDIFLEELNIADIKYNLDIGSSSGINQIASILINFEKILIDESPDGVIVYGDTNSTIGGALTAAKLNIPIFHIESGLRSFNKKMPEEVNRITTDRLSSILFCPSNLSQKNLKNEGIDKNIYVVGDVMYDIFYKLNNKIKSYNNDEDFFLLTLHREENTSKYCLQERFNQLSSINKKIIYPMHPRVKKEIELNTYDIPDNIEIIDPLSWLNLISLAKSSYAIITDSGGMQKEALWLNKFCFTLRNETEWIETIELGANKLIHIDEKNVDFDSIPNFQHSNPYGNGDASKKISEIIFNYLKEL